MAKKKSNFYHTRRKAGLNETRAADILGVTVEDIAKFDIQGAPVMAERLLLYWDRKAVGFNGWEGFLFSRGVLRYQKHRWTPETLLLTQKYINELNKAESELNELKSWSGVLRLCKHLLTRKTKKGHF